MTAGVVFQQPRLFPWRTVGGNVDLALKYAKVPRERRAERRAQLLERVGLEGTADRKIWEISGGQQQRVAIARALAAETPLFLLDEPFAALDALTRERLQEDVRQVSAESGRTTVFVTHSADEAAFLGSRIVVLTRRPGQVALDLPVNLPRGGVDADELRRSPSTPSCAPRSDGPSRRRPPSKTHDDSRCGVAPPFSSTVPVTYRLPIEGWFSHVRNHRHP